MAQFPGFAPAGGSSSTRSSTNNADVGMTDAEDDESGTPLEEAETPSISISRTADHFGKSLRISPPRLSIPNPARNYFAISAIVDPTFSAPPLPPDDDEMISSSSTPAEAEGEAAAAPQVLPMTPVYYPPPAPLPTVAVAVPVPAPVPAPAAPTVASSNYSTAAPTSRDPNADTPRPKPPPRNKVPLEKGYSQMVWLRLMQSEPDLAGLKGESARRLLTMEEIKKHRSEGEAWTILRGRVYNISPYLKYHPGGPEMLMKAAGIDCTALFNKYHAWVNAEFLLEKCLVGLLDVQGQGDK